jgi:hypothetical protein
VRGFFFPGMEVKQMDRKSIAALTPTRDEYAEELARVLTAISVVSRRLAKKLALLEGQPDPGRWPAGKGGDGTDGPRKKQHSPSG